MKLADRLVRAELMQPLLSLAAVLVALLALENMTRLLQKIDNVAAPLQLLLRSSAYLLPEHLAVGLPIVAFLSVALAIRRLSLRSELTALWAAGIPSMRIMRVPALLAIALFCAHLGLRGWLEPAGERALDRVGQEIRVGALGIRLVSGAPQKLEGGATLLVDRFDKSGHLHGVLLSTPHTTYAAATATVTNGGENGLIAHLVDGRVLGEGGSLRAIVFSHLDLVIPPPGAKPRAEAVMDEMDRTDDPSLIRIAERPGPLRLAAVTALALRFVQALLTLIMPVLAYPLAITQRGSQPPVGMIGGTMIVIAAVAASNAAGARAGAGSIVAEIAILLTVCVTTLLAWRAHRRNAEPFAPAVRLIVAFRERRAAVAGRRLLVTQPARHRTASQFG